jgi:hypothetical protein
MAITSLFGPTPAELILAQQQKQREEQLLRNQQIAQQGAEFGPFRGLYQAGLRMGDIGGQAIAQGLFPDQVDPRLQEATAVQGVLSKFSGMDQSDPKVLERIGRELMPVAPNAGLRALTLAQQLTKDTKETFRLMTPEEKRVAGLSENLTYQIGTTGQIKKVEGIDKETFTVMTPAQKRDAGLSETGSYQISSTGQIKKIEGSMEGTEFERILSTIPPENRQAYRVAWLKKQTSDSGMPASLVPIALKEADTISNVGFSVGEVNSVVSDLKSGKLKLGLKENFANQFKTLAGKSDEASRAYSKFNTTLETLRNARLNLNVGVQTEGDALRAANEFLANFDKYDTQTAIQRLGDVERKLSAAYQSKQNRLSSLYNTYGTPLPQGFFPSIGISQGKPSPSISDEVIRREFNDPKNAGWKDRGFDAFKDAFLKANPQ